MDADSNTPLAEAGLPAEHAARLLALADGLCAIGQLRQGRRAGQFSIFNFLIRAAEDPEHLSPDGRIGSVVMMRAGIIRRHAWYTRFWPPHVGRPLRLELPGPIDHRWNWHDAVEEITNRLDRSETWMQAVGENVEAHVERFAQELRSAEIVKLD